MKSTLFCLFLLKIIVTVSGTKNSFISARGDIFFDESALLKPGSIFRESRQMHSPGNLFIQSVEPRSARQPKQLGNNSTDGASVPTPIISLINRGVYMIDSRFNAFVEGVMVNMVNDLKRKQFDPLYFRVSDQGIIEILPYQRTSGLNLTGRRRKRQTSSNKALAGGVIRGLSKIRRFDDARIQKLGNVTLIRAEWIVGPLPIIIDFRGVPQSSRVKTEIDAIQFTTLTVIDQFGAEKIGFEWNAPLFQYMAYFGNRTLAQQQITELIVQKMFSQAAYISDYLEMAFGVASYDKIVPQFGSDSNYFSVIEEIFNSQQNRGGGLVKGRVDTPTIFKVNDLTQLIQKTQ